MADPIVKGPPDTLTSSVAVIGSGPGGSITAALLAERGYAVTLIEEGPFLPQEASAPFSLSEMESKYRNGGLNLALGRPPISFAEGRCVGGGSEVNSGLYHRLPAELMALWREQFEIADFTPASLDALFKAGEDDLFVTTIPDGRFSPVSEKLKKGAERQNHAALEIPRWATFDGQKTSLGFLRPQRQSMTRTFIPRFVKAGGTLLTDTRVSRLFRDGSRWQLEADHQGRRVDIKAENVFVCAGAIQTPALLQRSGISRLAGKTFGMHPTVKVVALFPEIVNAWDAGVAVHQVKDAVPHTLMGCSIATPPYLGLALLDHPAARARIASDWKRMAVFYCMSPEGGQGRVRRMPGSSRPLVTYGLSRSSWQTLARGISELSRMLLQAGAEACFPVYGGASPIRSESDIASVPAALPVRGTPLMTIHIFGSCPMGENVDRSVCNSFGKVHGTQGLYVSDASLFCTSPSINPQGTIMALARRNALHFTGALS